MTIPAPGEYIDIHVHDGRSADDTFLLESLMAHEGKSPDSSPHKAYTFGIHPWFLDDENSNPHLDLVRKMAADPGIVAVGEAGYDKIKGPSTELQRYVFEEQVRISELSGKPMIIHCVRSWEELLASHKKLKPSMPWMIHGFRGKISLAGQLLAKGFYLSFWFEFVIREESAPLLKSVPADRIFLETDGADIDIREIYRKAASDLMITAEVLKSRIRSNYFTFFGLKNA